MAEPKGRQNPAILITTPALAIVRNFERIENQIGIAPILIVDRPGDAFYQSNAFGRRAGTSVAPFQIVARLIPWPEAGARAAEEWLA